MKKVLFIAAALFVCTSYSFAVDLESESFDVYSLSPLTASALDYAVMPLADSGWSSTDSNNLESILELLGGNSVVGNRTLYYLIRDLSSTVSTIQNYFVGGGTFASPSSNSILGQLQYLPNLVSLQTMEYNLDYIEESTSSILSDTSRLNSTLSSFYNHFWWDDWHIPVYDQDENGNLYQKYEAFTNFPWFIYMTFNNLTSDSVNPFTRERSLYSRIAQLQEVLASDDDLALAESQKQNREEIEDSFLNGSSGSTSLGASDFGDLSDVGGTVNDTLSLNGQASVSSFTSGLAGADESGQGWFSAATRDSLDSVSGSVSTFALDDPYNMVGWHDRYAWVEGD